MKTKIEFSTKFVIGRMVTWAQCFAMFGEVLDCIPDKFNELVILNLQFLFFGMFSHFLN